MLSAPVKTAQHAFSGKIRRTEDTNEFVNLLMTISDAQTQADYFLLPDREWRTRGSSA